MTDAEAIETLRDEADGYTVVNGAEELRAATAHAINAIETLAKVRAELGADEVDRLVAGAARCSSCGRWDGTHKYARCEP